MPYNYSKKIQLHKKQPDRRVSEGFAIEQKRASLRKENKHDIELTIGAINYENQTKTGQRNQNFTSQQKIMEVSSESESLKGASPPKLRPYAFVSDGDNDADEEFTLKKGIIRRIFQEEAALLVKDFRSVQKTQIAGFKHLFSQHTKQTAQLRREILDKQISLVARIEDIEENVTGPKH